MRSSFVSSFQNFKMEPEKEKNKTKPEKKTHGVLQPRSSRLLINDDFPFRLEKVNCVLYFSIHPPSSAPWELFYGWPRSRWRCSHHLRDHATFVRTPHICQIGIWAGKECKGWIDLDGFCMDNLEKKETAGGRWQSRWMSQASFNPPSWDLKTPINVEKRLVKG